MIACPWYNKSSLEVKSMNRSALCIKMLMILKARGSKQPVSTKELAQALETNPRNIREFKKELVTAGFNIVEKKGPYGGYMLPEDSLFPVLRLLPEEISALQEAGEFMRGHKEMAFQKTFQQALDKVLNMSRIKAPVAIRYIQAPGSQVSARIQAMMDRVIQAIELHYTLVLSYQGSHDQEPLSFQVDPYDVIHYRNTYYLVGFSHLRKEYRIYRFSEQRMKAVEWSSQSFLWDSQYQLMSIISRFGIIKNDFKRVEVFVQKDMIDRFEEYKGWGIDLCKEKEGKQGALYSFKSSDRYELYRQIFSFDGKVSIQKPKAYRDEFYEKIRAWKETGDKQ